ncbi:spore gernimation protein, partial [Xanthomonas citri pv. citri]|nr:spore gernimation protein [Xanthomonas citri pv. citri]
QKESYSPEETTADYMLKDMMQRMNSQQTDSQNRVSLLPEGVQMNYSVEEDVLVVNFNSQYSSMSRARELLVRAGVVKTFLQVP